MLQCFGSEDCSEGTHEYVAEEPDNAGIPPKMNFTGKTLVEARPPTKMPMKMVSLLQLLPE